MSFAHLIVLLLHRSSRSPVVGTLDLFLLRSVIILLQAYNCVNWTAVARFFKIDGRFWLTHRFTRASP
jgi:hypothetical protein